MNKISKSIRYKSISLMIVLIILLNTVSMPISVIGSDVAAAYASSADAQSSRSATVGEEGSLDEIRIPNYSTNPNTLSNNHQLLPIYTSGVYNYLRNYSSEFTSYGRYYTRNETRSQYYTGSLLVHGNISEHSKNASTSSLPYTEERSLMYHPELTASGDGYLSGTLFAEDYEYSTPMRTAVPQFARCVTDRQGQKPSTLIRTTMECVTDAGQSFPTKSFRVARSPASLRRQRWYRVRVLFRSSGSLLRKRAGLIFFAC